MSLPEQMRWLFWNVDFDALDEEEHRDTILARVLERGRWEDVQWALECYGKRGIHRFLREVGHPELSRRTLRFWRVALDAKEETWASLPDWRRNSSAPWID